MIRNLKDTKGISMISLVITVIILIILTGVVLTFAMGENGIINGAVKGRIMNKVQSLDDTIKAYSIKNRNDYSAKKKSVSDLMTEGMLVRIPMTDGRTLNYVTNNGLQVLGLKFRGNDFDVNQNKEYTDEELMTMGIYVVDNSLNAAYLANNQVYGNLFDYGIDRNIGGEGMYNGKALVIKPQQLVDSSQEVIVILDCTSSMLSRMADRTTGTIGLNHSDPEAGYYSLRWGEAIKAMDALVDSYLTEDNNIKKLTIFTYYGKNGRYQIDREVRIISNQEAKNYYHPIFSLQHYGCLLKKYSGNTTKIANGVTQSNYSMYGVPNCRLGQGTCTPAAMESVVNYIRQHKDDGIPMDVILMSDGESNQGNDNKLIHQYAKEINETVITSPTGNSRNVGLYAVGLSYDASGLKNSFTYQGDKQIIDDNFYTATEAGALAEAFKAIINEVNNKEEMTIITTGKLLDEYENVEQVVIDVYPSSDPDAPHQKLTFTKDSSVYNLDLIYDDNKIDLAYAFQWIDTNPAIGDDYDMIEVNILYR